MKKSFAMGLFKCYSEGAPVVAVLGIICKSRKRDGITEVMGGGDHLTLWLGEHSMTSVSR